MFNHIYLNLGYSWSNPTHLMFIPPWFSFTGNMPTLKLKRARLGSQHSWSVLPNRSFPGFFFLPMREMRSAKWLGTYKIGCCQFGTHEIRVFGDGKRYKDVEYLNKALSYPSEMRNIKMKNWAIEGFVKAGKQIQPGKRQIRMPAKGQLWTAAVVGLSDTKTSYGPHFMIQTYPAEMSSQVWWKMFTVSHWPQKSISRNWSWLLAFDAMLFIIVPPTSQRSSGGF